MGPLLQVKPAILRTSDAEASPQTDLAARAARRGHRRRGGVWLVASAKSDFERRYDRIKIEMTNQEVMEFMEPEQPSFVGSWFVEEGQGGGYSRYEWANNGEQIVLAFQFGRLKAKAFIPLPAAEKLRRWWQRTPRRHSEPCCESPSAIRMRSIAIRAKAIPVERDCRHRDENRNDSHKEEEPVGECHRAP